MRTATGCLAVLLGAGVAFAGGGGGDITLKNRGGDVVFSHDSHVGAASIDCRECHAGLYLSSSQHKAVTMKQMEKGASCGACHNGKKVFSVAANCATCHRK